MKTYGWRIGANEITEIGRAPTAAKVINKKRSRADAVRELRELMEEISEDIAKGAINRKAKP